MHLQIDAALRRAIVAWVDAARRHARVVLLATAGVTLVAATYTAFHLGVNTDGRSMVSEDVDFRRVYDAFAREFPILDDAILIVVDGESGLAAGEAADALAARLEQEQEIFRGVYAFGSGEFFERNALLFLESEDLEDLADRLALLQPLLAELARDGSLGGFVDLIRTGIERSPHGPATGIDWTPVFERMSQATRAVLEHDAQVVSWETLILPAGLPGTSTRRVLVADPVLEFHSLLPARAAVQAIRAAGDELALEQGGDVRVRVTGNPVLNYEEMLGIAREVFTAGVGSFAVVALVLWAGLRSRRLVVGTLVALLSGLVWTAAFATAAVGQLNLLSITFAVLFIGLGVDFGIHLAMRYGELRRQGHNHADGLRQSAGDVGGSLAICAVTTAIGFFVFLPTDYVAVAELGLISGTGMFVSLFCMLTILPAWLTVVGGDDPLPAWTRNRERVALALERAAGWPFRHARAIRVGAAVAALGALTLVPSLEFDPNVVRLRDPTTESVQTFESLLESADTSPWNIDIVAADTEGAAQLARALEPLEEVDEAVVLADFLPPDQDEKREVLADVALFMGPRPAAAAAPRLPTVSEAISGLTSLRQALRAPGLVNGNAEQNEAVARLDADLVELLRRLETGEDPLADLATLDENLLASLRDHVEWLWTAIEPGPATVDDLPAALAARMRTDDGRARIQVIPREDLNEPGALRRFVEAVAAEVPDATGSAVSLVGYSRTIVRSLEQALVSAVLVIAVLLLLLWRRVSDATIVLGPLLLAALLTGAFTVVLATPFNFVNVIVLPLLLGIGVDSGIHLVHRSRHEGAAGLLRTSTARSVALSAITTIASFGTLAFSGHRGMASLGLLLTVGVATMLVCNLIVLPALLAGRVRGAAGDAHAEPLEPVRTQP